MPSGKTSGAAIDARTTPKLIETANKRVIASSGDVALASKAKGGPTPNRRSDARIVRSKNVAATKTASSDMKAGASQSSP
jgi:hypothetical protein